MLTSAWHRKPHTHLISIIDLIFPIFMLILHTYNFSFQDRTKLEVIRGLIDIDQHWAVYVIIWTIIYVGNVLEFYIAFQLFSSLRPDYGDAQLVVNRCERWLLTSSLIFFVLLIKFLMFMVHLATLGRVDAISLFVCLVDIIFRMVSVYIVKRFVDDLKTQLPPPQPSVFFINMVSKNNNAKTNPA